MSKDVQLIAYLAWQLMVLSAVECARMTFIHTSAFAHLIRVERDFRGVWGLAGFLLLIAAYLWVMFQGELTPVQVGAMAFAGLFFLVA